jgi:hypothetical protein
MKNTTLEEITAECGKIIKKRIIPEILLVFIVIPEYQFLT